MSKYFVAVEVRPVEVDEHGQPVEKVTEQVRYDDFVRWLLKPDTEPMVALHIAVGLAGELGEITAAYSDAQYFEEYGDFEFYLQAYCNHYGIRADEDLLTEEFPTPLTVLVGDVCDLIKRQYIYKKAQDINEVIAAYKEIRRSLDVSYKEIGWDRAKLLQANANKLAERYAKLRYSDEAAIARADKKGKED